MADQEAGQRQELVDASAQMVWTTDPEGAVAEDSPSWRSFTGQSQDERKGWGWLGALHPEDRASVEREWREAVQSQTSFDREFRVYHAASKSYRWTSARAVPLREDEGSLRGWVGMNTDITDRKEAEEALRRADQRKDEFLAMLGHELRNPLAAIRNGVMAAEASVAAGSEAPPGNVVQGVLGLVDRQSRHMTRLVDDLLDVTRITRNKVELRREPTDVARIAGEVAATHQPEVERAEVSLVLEVPDEPLMIDADPERLTQILDNLLLNAINFTGRGGKIVLRAERGDGRGLVVIRDSGIGMEPAVIQTLFEPYQQVDPQHGSKGLGLGLPLVKSLVDLHGGTIVAESDGPGHGSEFRVGLPLASEPEPPTDDPTSAPTKQPPVRRVLVVDDQTDVADAFASLLEGLGQDVRVAYSGESALQVALEQRPEIAFLDLAMPGMNGPELAEQLRRHFSPEELTLVALSGFGRKKEPPVGHFQHHLVKPAEVATVSELLSRVGT